MEENKIGLIPSVMVNDSINGPAFYGLLFTDRRSLFVLMRKYNTSAAVLGGAIGAALSDVMNDGNPVDFINSSIEELSCTRGCRIIPHTALQSISIKKKMTGYWIGMEFLNQKGKLKKINAQLLMPSELIARRKSEGLGRGEMLRDYAQKACQIIERALPPSIVMGMERSI